MNDNDLPVFLAFIPSRQVSQREVEMLPFDTAGRPAGYSDAAISPRFLRPRWRSDMRLPDEIINSVFFIGTKSDGKFQARATGFLVMAADGDFDFMHLVTAEHVITGLFNKQAQKVPGFEEIVLRFNSKDGGAPVEQRTTHDQWRFHPDPAVHTDVAVAAFDLPDGTDTIYVPSDMLATPEKIKSAKIGVGDEVNIIGLFRSHYGVGKNIAIVRTGNIAAMADEPIFTRYAGYIDGHLIEARSIGGLSGSPVWVHIPPDGNHNRLVELTGTKDRIYLLGLMHGHFDVKNLTGDSVVDGAADDSGLGETSINTGIGVVIPAQRILETLQHSDLTDMRKRLIKWAREAHGATPDLDASPSKPAPSTTAGNPRHKEDFSRLVGAAAKTPRRDE